MKGSEGEGGSEIDEAARSRAANLEATIASIHQIGWFARQDLLEEMGRHGLSLMHYLALELLCEPDPRFGPGPGASREADEKLSMRALGDGIGAAPSTITAMVDALVEKGYAERVSNPTDRRVVRVGVTGEGCAFVRRLRDRMLESQQDSMASVSDEEIEVIVRVFDKLLAWHRSRRAGPEGVAR